MLGWTVLIADDEPHITEVVRRRLERAGLTVLVAADGEEAFELARETGPDLVVTDLQMPYMSGLELAVRLKINATTSATPIIMLTARGYVLDQEEAARTNIRVVMSKPFAARELEERVLRELEADSSREAA